MEEMQLATMEETATTYPAQEGRTPWRRLWARSFDVTVFGALLFVVLSPLFPKDSIAVAYFDGTIQMYFGFLLVLLLEPILISRFGTTPGKKLMGIRVMQSNGEKLTLQGAKIRTCSVYKKGMGFCIPIYDLYRQYKSWGLCDRGELSWDDGISYEVEEKWVAARMIGALFLNSLIGVLVAWITSI